MVWSEVGARRSLSVSATASTKETSEPTSVQRVPARDAFNGRIRVVDIKVLCVYTATILGGASGTPTLLGEFQLSQVFVRQ